MVVGLGDGTKADNCSILSLWTIEATSEGISLEILRFVENFFKSSISFFIFCDSDGFEVVGFFGIVFGLLLLLEDLVDCGLVLVVADVVVEDVDADADDVGEVEVLGFGGKVADEDITAGSKKDILEFYLAITSSFSFSYVT